MMEMQEQGLIERKMGNGLLKSIVTCRRKGIITWRNEVYITGFKKNFSKRYK